jgi:hypothetical protein
MPCSSWSSTAHSDITRQPRQRNLTALDSNSTRRRMESASTGSTGTRQELDRLDKARQARPRQRPRQRLDGASTEPRQLDSSTARAQRVLLLFKPCIRLDDVCFQVQGPHRHVAAKSRGLRGLFPLALALLGREFTQPGAVRVYRGLLAQQLAHSAAAAGSGKTS